MNPPILGEKPAPLFWSQGLGSSDVFPGEMVCRGLAFREVDGNQGWRMRYRLAFAAKSFKLGPKKLEAGASASGVEGFPEPTARWTLNRV
jgi:hypothetical protein